MNDPVVAKALRLAREAHETSKTLALACAHLAAALVDVAGELPDDKYTAEIGHNLTQALDAIQRALKSARDG